MIETENQSTDTSADDSGRDGVGEKLEFCGRRGIENYTSGS